MSANTGMSDDDFDAAVVAAVFGEAGLRGWRNTSLVEAARAAGLDLARTRRRFPSKLFVLMRFGSLADQAALDGATTEGPLKDRLFDMIMRRFDVLQAHRAGVLAVLDAAAMDPMLGLFLARLSARSMSWMLEGAGVSASGLRGPLRIKGLLAVWLWAVRAWRQDESADLTATMTAADRALDRAGELARSFRLAVGEMEGEAGGESAMPAPPMTDDPSI
ncbi:TetR family transcriptional regulator [Acidisoma sp. C75]